MESTPRSRNVLIFKLGRPLLTTSRKRTWPEDGAACGAHMDEASGLELKIVATPAFTSKGLTGKRRVVGRAEFKDDDGILAAILQADTARVAAAG